jgi:hypothetical protein
MMAAAMPAGPPPMMARSHTSVLFRTVTAQGLRTGRTSDGTHFKSGADTRKASAYQPPRALIACSDIDSHADFHHTLEAGTHVAVGASTLLQAVFAESPLAVREQGGGNGLALICLHPCAFEQEIAALAAMSTLSHSQIHGVW